MRVTFLLLAAGVAWTAPRREIPAGWYRNPFRPPPSDSAIKRSGDGLEDGMKVAPFRLDERAVTTAGFLAFVKTHPEWAKSRAQAPFVDSMYLASWLGDREPPPGRFAEPVTEVSWFAAKAYCEAAGGRLPATDEWERVAAALPAGQDSIARNRRILAWYGRPASADAGASRGSRDAFGIRDLYGRVWEWTADFNAIRPGAEADKAFCGAAGQATARGADYAAYMRYSFRSSLRPDYAVSSLGFRCADGAARRIAPLPPADLPAGSLYLLRSEWEDDIGRRQALAAFRGKARILTLFFSHCQSTCPMVLGTLKGLAEALPKGWEARAGIVMATLDPGRDGAAALAEFRRRMSLSPEGYVLLHGQEEDTRELAMALGAAYRKSEANGGIEHEAVIAVLDPEGRVAHRHDGTVDAATLSRELMAAAGESLSP
ncbi:MAG: SUMF1/EgtB/PvdO family nonheme iron enzyme [Fibrobacteres bacterium]|nr:SUMF1/EgtB/PvdO family nonheme iron enzyme [Fibrobacterota bacterium]